MGARRGHSSSSPVGTPGWAVRPAPELSTLQESPSLWALQGSCTPSPPSPCRVGLLAVPPWGQAAQPPQALTSCRIQPYHCIPGLPSLLGAAPAVTLSCLEATCPVPPSREDAGGKKELMYLNTSDLLLQRTSHTAPISRLWYSVPLSPRFSASRGTRAPTTACSSAWKGHCLLGGRRPRRAPRSRHAARPNPSTLPTMMATTTALPTRASPTSSSFFTVRHGAAGHHSQWGLGHGEPSCHAVGGFGVTGRGSGLSAHLRTTAPAPAPAVGPLSPSGASLLQGSLRGCAPCSSSVAAALPAQHSPQGCTWLLPKPGVSGGTLSVTAVT